MKIKRIQLKHDILRYVRSSQCLIFEWVPYPRVNTLLSHIKSFQKFTGSPWWYIKNTFIRLILPMYFQSNSQPFNQHPYFWHEKSRFASNPRISFRVSKPCVYKKLGKKLRWPTGKNSGSEKSNFFQGGNLKKSQVSPSKNPFLDID